VRRAGLALVGLGLAATALGAGIRWWPRAAPPAVEPARLSVAEALGGEPGAGFARALGPRRFVFPDDHGPHPEFRTEWWYYTGTLEATEVAAAGRRFGFQLTVFRVRLAPQPVARASAWGTSEVYFAHFALTDVASGRFQAHERWSRAALGLAGATARPFRVWVEDWTIDGPADGAAALPMRLRAGEGPVALDLRLESAKPPVLQGDRGLSPKSAAPGNASYYYSLTRLPARGTVRLGDRTLAVRGLAWMDREWSTSALGADQVGWDWFALQLDDGRELMLYRLRRRDGSPDPVSAGSLVAPDGAARPLGLADAEVDVLGHWASPRDGARYPARWRVRVPSAGLDLEVRPLVADQELALTVRYWEGAVAVAGTASGQPVTGAGYVELTGYAAGSPPGSVRQ
jgi:predicted secreted hydrolase